MSELRRDPIIGRWNIIDTDQPAGPEGFEVESQALGGGKCPFCSGNEAMTPPEIYVVRPVLHSFPGCFPSSVKNFALVHSS